MTEWWTQLDFSWIGAILGLVLGLLLGRVWRNIEVRDRLLVLRLQLEAKSSEASALRAQVKRFRTQFRMGSKTDAESAGEGAGPWSQPSRQGVRE